MNEDILFLQAEYITRMYKRLTGHVPILRIKDEVAVYPLPKIWLSNNIEHLDVFCRLIKKGTTKFPQNDVAFVLNLLPILRDKATESLTASWYHGYFTSYAEKQAMLLLEYIKEGEFDGE